MRNAHAGLNEDESIEASKCSSLVGGGGGGGGQPISALHTHTSRYLLHTSR